MFIAVSHMSGTVSGAGRAIVNKNCSLLHGLRVLVKMEFFFPLYFLTGNIWYIKSFEFMYLLSIFLLNSFTASKSILNDFLVSPNRQIYPQIVKTLPSLSKHTYF